MFGTFTEEDGHEVGKPIENCDDWENLIRVDLDYDHATEVLYWLYAKAEGYFHTNVDTEGRFYALTDMVTTATYLKLRWG